MARGRVARHSEGRFVTSIWRLKDRLLDPSDSAASNLCATATLCFEVLVSIAIVALRPYTEIDWSTYMQQVQLFLDGERNYTRISGDTGPIVYPAFHLYAYSIFYSFSNAGKSIFTGQVVFIAIYLFTVYNVFEIFKRTKRVPPFVYPLTAVLGYRIHSIYMLRMFNDGIAMMFVYCSLLALINLKSIQECSSFDILKMTGLLALAVNVKMNVLLFFPAFFVVLYLRHGFRTTFTSLIFLITLTLLMMVPFYEFPRDYVQSAFNFGRVFLYKWTVNWKCVSEVFFLDKEFHKTLLLLHVASLAVFLILFFGKSLVIAFGLDKGKLDVSKLFKNGKIAPVATHDAVMALFFSNFLGIAFSRSLHYQFYSWYYHTIPYMLFSFRPSVDQKSDNFQNFMGVLIVLLVEVCWNTYPATSFSSSLLHICHFIIFLIVCRKYYNESSVNSGNNVKNKHN